METEYAWAAGFFDGEGNTHLGYRVYGNSTVPIPRVMLQVAQVDRRVLDRFQRILGFGKVGGPYAPKTINSKPYYYWRVEGLPYLLEFQDKIGPYLDEVKTIQLNKALSARAEWEATAVCKDGYRFQQSKSGYWYCPHCRSQNGVKAMASRYKEKD